MNTKANALQFFAFLEIKKINIKGMFYSQIFAMYKIVNIKCIATAEIKKTATPQFMQFH